MGRRRSGQAKQGASRPGSCSVNTSAAGQYGPGRHVFDYDIRGRTVLQSCSWSDTLGVIGKQGMSVPDLSQVDWAKVISLSFNVVPVVYKYRSVLPKIPALSGHA